MSIKTIPGYYSDPAVEPAASTAPSTQSRATATHSPRQRRRWSPRFFEGTDIFTWLRYLARVRGRVDPPYWYIAAIITVSSTINVMLRYLRDGWHGERIAQTPITHPPLFVVGHWRTGTTLLHELLCCDPQFAYPDFFACFNPNQLLLTEGFFKNYARFLAPEQRPMDNMTVAWDKPQEDEFALCLLGLPSPYADLAFPQSAPLAPGTLDLSGLSPQQLQQWKRRFVRYLQLLTYRDPRPLVLKSPPHTARVPILLELLPSARFVHIVRDPRMVIPSTLRMLQAMTRSHCLQRPHNLRLHERTFENFNLLYQRWEQARPLLRPDQVYELRYEALIRNPLEELRRIYDHLGILGFDQAQPYFQNYLRQTKGYETNKYTLTKEQQDEIEQRCAVVLQRYGY